MIDIYKYLDKTVKVITKSGEAYSGLAFGAVSRVENFNWEGVDEDSIEILTDPPGTEGGGAYVALFPSEIESIEVVE